jgi:hypothetical protein
MAVKTADERLDSAERTIKIYRILVFVLFVTILVIERVRVVAWLDSFERWISGTF